MVAGARLGLLLYLEGLAGTSQIWEGEEINTGEKLRVAYLGDERAMRFNAPLYLQHILFRPDTVTVKPVRQFPMLLARKEAERLAPEADMVIVDANGWLMWKPKSGCSVSTPNWIRMEFIFEPGETWEDVQRRFRSHKNNVKRVLQNGYQYRISHDEADFELFYHQMYIPLIQSRYGQYGAIDWKSSMLKEFQDGFLLMIEDANGQPISAQLTRINRKTMYSLSNGLLNGDPELHSKGALAAIYYFSIKWCYEHGMERFDMGGCRPFQTDGLYQFKQHWGMTPASERRGGRSWLFWAPRGAHPATAWMDANPTVSLDSYWKENPPRTLPEPAPQAAAPGKAAPKKAAPKKAAPKKAAAKAGPKENGKLAPVGGQAIPVTGKEKAQSPKG